jgi:hypothetical protein
VRHDQFDVERLQAVWFVMVLPPLSEPNQRSKVRVGVLAVPGVNYLELSATTIVSGAVGR